MIKVTEIKGKVLIGKTVIDGFVDTIQNKKCPECQSLRVYYEKYDAYFCPQCDVWLEPKCNDPKCQFCAIRPDKPLP